MLIFMYILCTCAVARNGCRVLRTTTPVPLGSISFQRGVTFLCQMLEICRRCLAVSRCSSADLVCSIVTFLFCSVVVSSHHANPYLCAFEVHSFLFFRRRFRVSRHCHCCCRRTCSTILMWWSWVLSKNYAFICDICSVFSVYVFLSVRVLR